MLQATADNSPLGPTTRCAHCRMRERITLGRNVQNVIAEPGWCSRVRRSSLAVDAYMDLTFHTGLLGSSLSNRECTESAALGYSVSTEGRAMTTQMLAVASVARGEGAPSKKVRCAAASHISRGSKVSAANIVRITTPQNASAPTPGSIVITEPNATSAPSSDSMKMSIIDQRPMKRTM